MRVFELAEELGVEDEAILRSMSELNQPVANKMSVLSSEQILVLRDRYRVEAVQGQASSHWTLFQKHSQERGVQHSGRFPVEFEENGGERLAETWGGDPPTQPRQSQLNEESELEALGKSEGIECLESDAGREPRHGATTPATPAPVKPDGLLDPLKDFFERYKWIGAVVGTVSSAVLAVVGCYVWLDRRFVELEKADSSSKLLLQQHQRELATLRLELKVQLSGRIDDFVGKLNPENARVVADSLSRNAQLRKALLDAARGGAGFCGIAEQQRNGNFRQASGLVGRRALASVCASTCGSSVAHLCTEHELLVALGSNPSNWQRLIELRSIPERCREGVASQDCDGAWVDALLPVPPDGGAGFVFTDCDGWASSSGNRGAGAVSLLSGRGYLASCDSKLWVACCQ